MDFEHPQHLTRLLYQLLSSPTPHIVLRHSQKVLMATNDDTVPEAYPYMWESGSDLSIEEFLKKVRESRQRFRRELTQRIIFV